MENTYGYIRTSRQRIAGEAGSDPEAPALQLRGAGVALGDIYRDVGISGSIGTNSRAGWHALNARLTADDTLVVAGYRPYRAALDGHGECCALFAGQGSQDKVSLRNGGFLGVLPGGRPRYTGGLSGGHTVELHGLGVGAGVGGHAAAHCGGASTGPGGSVYAGPILRARNAGCMNSRRPL